MTMAESSVSMADSTQTSLTPARKVEVAARIASTRALWAGAVHHDPARRRPVRLVGSDHYEVWVIGWTPGQQVELHDHGGSSAVVTVVEGALTELRVEPRGLSRRTFDAGAMWSIGPTTVHDILNTSATNATSIHVYSPSLTAMTYYDPLTFRPTRTDVVEQQVPELSPMATGQVLHPSMR